MSAHEAALLAGLMEDADNYAQTSVEFANHDRAGSERSTLEDNLRATIASTATAAPAETQAAEPVPYGQVTTHSQTGQQFFFRWPDPPYLDNASECVKVYAAPPQTRQARSKRVSWDYGYIEPHDMFPSIGAVMKALRNWRGKFTLLTASPPAKEPHK